MTRARKPIDTETSIAMREAFYEAVDSGGLNIAEGVKRMREIVNYDPTRIRPMAKNRTACFNGY